jgi:hypothetical protein
MATPADEGERRQRDGELEATSRARFLQVVDQTRIVIDASRAILHVMLPDDPGAEATAVADAFDSLQVSLTRLQKSLTDGDST